MFRPVVAVILLLFSVPITNSFRPSPSTTIIRQQQRQRQHDQISRRQHYILQPRYSIVEVNRIAVSFHLLSSRAIKDDQFPSMEQRTEDLAENMNNASMTDSSSCSGTLQSIVSEQITSTTMDFPWGNLQEWALRDKLKQYTITAPIDTAESQTLRSFILWRALTEDAPELAGYPIPFLVDRYMEICSADEVHSDARKASNDVLPYLDDFVFESNGGLSGRIYDMVGLAEGARIQTSPVVDVERTLPKGFVQTADGRSIYEVGKPASADILTNRMKEFDGVGRTSKLIEQALEQASPTRQTKDSFPSLNEQKDSSLLDREVVNLAGLTTVVIAGAMAAESLSHHLTVNVFWV